jgi:benzoyl-CoA reductase/2-hydroxyglutaryl-CoA dehydratase subunit BcrC/BadD/HgdB
VSRVERAGACPYFEDARDALTARARENEDVAGVIVTTTCDQARRGAEEVAARVPTFLLNVPHTVKPSARRLYRAELDRLGRWLVERGGRAPEPDDLVAVCEAYDGARRELRAARGRLSARAWAELAISFLAEGRPAVPAGAPDGRPSSSAVPLAIVGGPLWGRHLELYRMAEDAGGEIVLDGTETGERGLPAVLDPMALAADPGEELVRAYLDTIPDAFRRPNRDLHRWFARGLEERGVAGLIVVRCVWCDLWHAEVARLRESCGRPLADVDLAGDAGSLARAETRIQALVDAAR